jgi:uncharacterized protein (DUF1778 family)
MTKTVSPTWIGLTVNPEEKTLVKLAAALGGKTMSDYTRDLVLPVAQRDVEKGLGQKRPRPRPQIDRAPE